MAVTLERILGLTETQAPLVREVLRAREVEIAAFQEGIRKSGVLDIRSYEWKVSLFKASWYRQIDALLDGRQHDLFVPLVEGGFFNEDLAFTVEPGMTILE